MQTLPISWSYERAKIGRDEIQFCVQGENFKREMKTLEKSDGSCIDKWLNEETFCFRPSKANCSFYLYLKLSVSEMAANGELFQKWYKESYIICYKLPTVKKTASAQLRRLPISPWRSLMWAPRQTIFFTNSTIRSRLKVKLRIFIFCTLAWALMG